MSVVVKVVSKADGSPCLHSGRWVVAWNPHTPFGTCAIRSSPHRASAKLFADVEQVVYQWRTISSKEPSRPSDGEPNRPLLGVSIEIEDAAGGFPV